MAWQAEEFKEVPDRLGAFWSPACSFQPVPGDVAMTADEGAPCRCIHWHLGSLLGGAIPEEKHFIL